MALYSKHRQGDGALPSQEANVNNTVNIWIVVPCPACEGRGVDPWSERANPTCQTCHGDKHITAQEAADLANAERQEYLEAQAHILRARKLTKDSQK